MYYRSLATHNAACNWIFYKFQDCENEHPYRKFLGYCEDIQKELNECIKEQREIHKRENVRHGFKRLEPIEVAHENNRN